MTAVLSPTPFLQFFSSSGVPLIGGKVFTYIAGTSTKQATYTDSSQTTPNANPIPLDAFGQAAVWLDPTKTYKYVWTTANDTDPPVSPLGSRDNITGAYSGPITSTQLVYPQTATESGASVTPSNTSIISHDYIGTELPVRYGADPTGVADSRTALNNMSLVGKEITLTPGTYLINSNVTISPSVMPLSGSLLKPNSAVTATLSSPLVGAPISKIFDLSLGGSVSLTHSNNEIHAEWWGLAADNSTDDTSALNSAITAAGTTINGALGGAVNLNFTGNSIISSTVTLPNRVRMLGKNKRGTYFKASGSFSGTSMFNAVNGSSSMFDSTLENLTVDANNVASLGCVLSDAWQEDCGLRGALLVNFATYGIKFQNGFGGASLTNIRDCEIFGGTTTGAIGVDLQQISSVGAFLLKIQDTSITGTSGHNLSKGINVVKDSLHCDTVHFEFCDSAIFLDGVGQTILIGCTGSSSSVTNLVEIASTWTGTLTMIGCFRNGATNFVKDNRAGGLGTFSYDDPLFYIDGRATPTPPIAIGLPWSSGTFNGTAGTLTTGIGVQSLTKNATGDYTITESRARTSATTCAPLVTCNKDDVNITVNVLGAATFQIKLRTGGVATDASQVNFANIRTA